MTSQSSHADPPSPPQDDSRHLTRWRSLVKRIMADSKISPGEADELRVALTANNGRVTVDIIRRVVREQLGDGHLEFE